MVLAHVGVNRDPPGFARPGTDVNDPHVDRAASRVPANPVDDPTRRTGRGLAGPLACATPAPAVWCSVLGPGPQGWSPGEAATGPQRRQRAATRNQPSVLRRPHDCVPAGIPDTLQMLENIGTTIAD
jgi:hypothetical protein